VIPSHASGWRRLTDTLTCQWLAPFTPHRAHTVTLTLDSPVALGMLRVWHYNKSRIHAARGVREMEVTLDGRCVFRGEVRHHRKAPYSDAKVANRGSREPGGFQVLILSVPIQTVR
jgi:hypothetical protein